VRVTKLLRQLVGLCKSMVIEGWELHAGERSDRPHLVLRVARRSSARGRCGLCGEASPWFDRGGGIRSWRHIEIGYSTCEIRCEARRVSCRSHGPTVAQLPFARHGSAFTRDFADLVVHEAIASSKPKAAVRHGISWRAVNNACNRVVEEALGRLDLLSGLVAIAIDEVKYKKGQKYLTVVCDHFTGKVSGRLRAPRTVRWPPSSRLWGSSVRGISGL